MVVCTVGNYEVLRRGCELAQLNDVNIVCVKTELRQTIQPGMIDFVELVNPKGTICYDKIEVDTYYMIASHLLQALISLPQSTMMQSI